MKKIVSIIFTLFTVVLGVNAEVVTLSYDNFKAISSRGAISQTFNSSDVSVKVEFPEKFKGISRSQPYMYLDKSVNTDGNLVNITVSLNSENQNLAIKKVIINCITPDLLSNSAITCDNGGLMTESVNMDENLLTLSNDIYDVKTVTLSKKITSQVKVISISVEYSQVSLYRESVTLSDNESYPFVGQSVKAGKVSYIRELNGSNWGTLCLPFDYKVDDSKFTVYSILNKIDNDGKTSVSVSKYEDCDVVKAGTSIIYYCSGSQLKVSASDVLLTTDSYVNGISEQVGTTDNKYSYTIYGTLETKTMNNGFYFAKNLLYQSVGKTITIKPYRSWISTFDAVAAAKLRSAFADNGILLDEEATSIDEVDSEATQTIYNANGVVIPELQKGLNIIKTANGVKKVFVR